MNRVETAETKDKDDDEAEQMRQRLEELEAANLAMAEKLSRRTAATDMIDELMMSPGLLDNLGELLSPELRCKLRATTSAGNEAHNEQQQPTGQAWQPPEISRRRRKRAPAGASHLFRCCSAPQQAEH